MNNSGIFIWMLEHPEKDAPEWSALYFCLKKRKCDNLLKRDHVTGEGRGGNNPINRLLTVSPWMPEYRWFSARSHPSASDLTQTSWFPLRACVPCKCEKDFSATTCMQARPQHDLLKPREQTEILQDFFMTQVKAYDSNTNQKSFWKNKQQMLIII